MSLSLDANLQTAQDGASHHIILDLSISSGQDIPFDGEFLTSETTNETRSNILTHSSDRICVIYTFGTGNFKYVYTDTARTIFNFVTLSASDLGVSGKTLIEASICELTDGDIGIVFICSDGTNYYLRETVISVTGTIDSNALIATYAKASYDDVQSPFVIKMSNDNYLLVYILDTPTDVSRIYKRTASDFTSFSAESEIAPSGISSSVEKVNVSLVEITTNDIFLWFDYGDGTDYYNIYYSISADYGSTWGAIVKVTSYADATASGVHPMGVQKIADQLYLTYQERRHALHMDKDHASWPDDLSTTSGISQIVFNSSTRKLYIVNSNISVGVKKLYNILEIDPDTWTITNVWHDTSTPALNDFWFSDEATLGITENHHGDGYYIPIGNVAQGNKRFVAVLDANANTILEYNYDAYEAYSLDQTLVEFPMAHWGCPPINDPLPWYLLHTQVVFDSTTLYVVSYYTYANFAQIQIDAIDLTASADGEGIYPKTYKIRNQDYIVGTDTTGLQEGCFRVVENYNLDETWFFLSTFTNQTATKGKLFIYNSALEGNFLHYEDYPNKDPRIVPCNGDLDTYYLGGDNDFPYNGLKHFIIIGHTLYGSFEYQSLYGEEDHRGLVQLNLDTGQIIYHRPDWGSYDDYTLGPMTVTDDNKIIITTADYGITIFNPEDGTWELINNANTPGLTTDDNDGFWVVDYDDTNDTIFANTAGIGHHEELVALSVSGYMQETYYQIGTYSVSWSFGSASKFLVGVRDFDCVVTTDPDDSAFFAFWTKQVSEEYSIKWDKEIADFDLTPYLIADKTISLERSVENIPARLVFTLSSGHLFDSSNKDTIFKVYLRKGTKLYYRLGEKYGGTDYWQNQGTFLVKEKKIIYERGSYPIVDVVCEDISDLWQDMEIVVTSLFDGTYPETLLESILVNEAEWPSGDISISSFDDRFELYTQWVDVTVTEVLDKVCSFFGYYYRLNVDDDFVCKKIADDNSVDHIYNDSDSILRYMPNDLYSDYTNKVTVIGQERDFIDLYYNEEPLVTKNGTIGWWQGTERIRFPYADDYSLKARFPRFDWHTQLQGLFKWGGSIDFSFEESDDETYVDLIIEGPNLVQVLIELIALLITKYKIPDGLGSGGTVPIGRIAEGVVMIAIIDILGSMTNWQATVYAQPKGKARRSVQSFSEDLDHQDQIGKIVERRIEEPFCYSVSQCKEYADRELMIVQMQRSAVQLEKIGHLQDEDGDTIQIVHPYSGDNVKIFITKLTRTVHKGSDSNKSGIMKDIIEGWIVE